MRFRLVALGRDKFTGEVEVQSLGELLGKVRRHLRSRSVEIANDGAVFVGAARPVGRIEPVGDIARVRFERWFEEEAS